MRSFAEAFSLAVGVYAFAAWVYVALVALIQPQTLRLQLTHLSAWPRTDTFGEMCFVLSFAAFVVHRTLKGRRSAGS